ncbi:hypothetical protein HDU83_006734 [Entophlyctis luteolus]|nr:hypothetical protein HDU83_006734 [Entophlyctis luteolus]
MNDSHSPRNLFGVYLTKSSITISGGEVADIEVEVAVDVNLAGAMTVEDVLQQVLKEALVPDGLEREHAAFRNTDVQSKRRQVETCAEKEYVKLVEVLCAKHNINVIKVGDVKKPYEKVFGRSCVVVKGFGEDLEARSILLSSFQTL